MWESGSASAAALLACATLLVPVQSLRAQNGVTQCDESTEPASIGFGDSTTGCAIGRDVDLDRFVFNGGENDLIRVVVLGANNEIDPALQIRDPQGAIIDAASTSCNSTPESSCSFRADVQLPVSGQYQISISDAGSNEIGGYTLQLERLSPPLAPRQLSYNRVLNDSIIPLTDSDFFLFNGAQNTQVRIDAVVTNGDFNIALGLLSPSGEVQQLGSADCDAGQVCTLQSDVELLSSGSYQLIVSDAEYRATGSYRITLQCLFGNCPITPLILSDGFEQAR